MRHPLDVPIRRLLVAASTLACAAGMGRAVSAQAVDKASRLAGVLEVDVRAEAMWDEAITMSAGGATQEQFQQALAQTFRGAITEADAAPSVVDGAPATVVCHVDTYYETGLIVYSLRVQVEQPGADSQPVITWIKSSVGSYTAQQMHQMFRLGEQCARSFLVDWRAGN